MAYVIYAPDTEEWYVGASPHHTHWCRRIDSAHTFEDEAYVRGVAERLAMRCGLRMEVQPKIVTTRVIKRG